MMDRLTLKYVLQVAQSIGEQMQHHLVVVDKSTVPIGTADKVKETIQHALNARNSRSNLSCSF